MPADLVFHQEGPKQKRTSLRTRNHEVARQKARALEAELSGAVPRQAGTVDIAAAVQAYLDWQDSNDRAPKTMLKYRDVLTRFAAHCRDAGVRLMHAITTQTVDEFGVRRRRDGMAAKTVYTELTIVRQWLNFAVTRRMLAASPVAGTKLVKPKPGPRDYWRQEQLDAIVEAAKAPYKAAFLLMAETGMRIGEVVHLTHDDLTLTGPTPVALFKEPWKPGRFDSTISNQRRGRDSQRRFGSNPDLSVTELRRRTGQQRRGRDSNPRSSF